MMIGVDIGGTKTHLAAESGDGGLRERVVETATWRRRLDDGADADALVAMMAELANADLRAERGPGATAAIVLGAHGCDTDADCLALQARLAQRISGTVLVLNDSELLLPAAGRDSGICVIAGTGSIAVSRGADRAMMAAGGWGWFLGDEGSASGLVRDAGRAVRLSLDRGEPLDPLGAALVAALDVSGPVELGRAMVERGSAAGVGSLARLVFDAAEAGSPIAGDVIAQGGEALALLVEQLVRRGASGRDVVAAGGVISHQPALYQAFVAALARRVPDARPTLLAAPPVTGALALARDLAAGRRPATLPLPHSAGRLELDQNGRAA